MLGLRLKPLVASASVAVLILALLATTGCASTATAPVEIDTERDISEAAEKALGLLGRGIVEVAKVAPGAEEAIDGIDTVRREAAERVQKRRSAKQDKRDSAFHDKLCQNSPCNAWCVENRPVPAGFCSASGSEPARSAQPFEYVPEPQEVRVPAPHDGRVPAPAAVFAPTTPRPIPAAPPRASVHPALRVSQREPAGANARTLLRERIKIAEGGIRLYVYHVKGSPHVCAGHSIRENDDAHRFAGNITVEKCEALLDEDIEKAQIRAIANLGLETDDAIEACFLVGCNDMDIADVVAELRSRNTARGTRLAAGLLR